MKIAKADASGSLDASDALSSTERVVHGILRALEQQRLVPGQRIIETELAIQCGVGRNAVREAMQQLAARGIVDLSRNRSPSIRTLDVAEALEVVEVAGAMTGLLAGCAARGFNPSRHLRLMRTVSADLAECEKTRDLESFNRARREFYRALLHIAANRELRRLFLTIHMELIHAQYRSRRLQDIRFADYRAICGAVIAGDVRRAATTAKQHVRRVGKVIRSYAVLTATDTWHADG